MSRINPFAHPGSAGRAALLLGATLALCASAPVAQAQVSGWWGYRVYEDAPVYVPEASPRFAPRSRIDYRGMLEDDGYRVIAPIQRRGPVVLADVIDSRGRSARLVIDAQDGSVLDRFEGAGPRPPRDIASAPPSRSRGPDAEAYEPRVGDRIIETEPKVVPGVGPQKRATTPAQRPAVAARDPAAKDPAKSPTPAPSREKKPLASQAVKPPAPTPAQAAPEPVKPPEPAAITPPAEEPQAAPAARSVRVIPLNNTPAAPTEAPAAPADPAPPANSAGYANGVPINPLE